MEGLVTNLTGALTTGATEMTSIIGTVVTIAMPVVVGMMVVKFGIKSFRAVTGR